jgi:hypothetical protein
MFYTKGERLTIVLDIVMKLKNYKYQNGQIVNLYNNNYSFIPEFKKIHNNYIQQKDDNNIKEFKGELFFEEIGKRIEYILPSTIDTNPLFVIRAK